MKKKTVALLLAIVLVVGCAVGGTVAWLTQTTGSIVNTFTVGNIGITLTEAATNFKMVPGQPITKDPKVTVAGGSEACWLFIKMEKSTNLDTYISYTIDSGWTQLTDVDGVWYRAVPATSTDTPFDVLTGNTVTVKDSVTKDMMDTLGTALPTMTFTAYAVQRAGFDTAAAAWAQVPQPSPNP
jgi:hypothetical protein